MFCVLLRTCGATLPHVSCPLHRSNSSVYTVLLPKRMFRLHISRKPFNNNQINYLFVEYHAWCPIKINSGFPKASINGVHSDNSLWGEIGVFIYKPSARGRERKCLSIFFSLHQVKRLAIGKKWFEKKNPRSTYTFTYVCSEQIVTVFINGYLRFEKSVLSFYVYRLRFFLPISWVFPFFVFFVVSMVSLYFFLE